MSYVEQIYSPLLNSKMHITRYLFIQSQEPNGLITHKGLYNQKTPWWMCSVQCSLDDIIVYANTCTLRKMRLKAVQDRLNDSGIK